MLAVVYAIIEYRENMKPDEELDPVIVADLGKRFYQALEQGKIDYEENPPSKYYRDGYNLWKRMYEKPEEYIRTLYDKRVPPTNNDALCEYFIIRTKDPGSLAIKGFRDFFYSDKATYRNQITELDFL